MVFGSIAGSDYYCPPAVSIQGEHNNQNQIWRLNIGKCMVFGSIAGSDYYYRPPAVSIRGEYNIQNQIWCQKHREMHGFWVHRGF